MDFGLKGKVCIVTGASRGIGLATVRTLANEGARVLRVARGVEDGDDSVALDVTTPDAGERLLAACGERLGTPWALVNAAGASGTRSFDELPDEVWQEQWELHVMGPMRLMRALAPHMADAGGGRVVNVCSSSARRPSGTLDPSYSVTKAAQLSLSRAFADAFAARGVLVNAVNPGPVEGALWHEQGGLADQAAAAKGVARDEVLEATRSRIPLGRFGTEDEVAMVIAFLCSGLASNVAGAAWSVDGGSVPSIF
jgi:NAD(P)-dependent dehydrogenase (short-subunit alcohol dehydrogenase family)